MKTLKAILALALAAAASAAFAEPDTFYLGNGQDGEADVTASNTVINKYTQVQAGISAGATSVTVANISGFSWSQGDLLMVLQTSGSPEEVSASQVGRWEFARVQSVANASGNRILTLTAPLGQSFPALRTQVIHVPEYTALTISSGASITAAAWDGAKGGVIAFMVQDRLINDGTINAGGAGFRGGDFAATAEATCSSSEAGKRGEGIGGQHNVVGSASNVNGGGGGGCGSSGGGGGGNRGAGAAGTASGAAGAVAGAAGAALTYDADRQWKYLYLGGGGGGGHGKTGTGDNGGGGGRGGGIVFIRAGSMIGVGSINASGASGGAASTGGAGGGGAGGSIHMRFSGHTTCGGGGITATGGNGGVASEAGRAGGAGGWGYIFYQFRTRVCPASAGDNSAVSAVQEPFSQPEPATIISPVDGAYVNTLTPTIQVAAPGDKGVVVYREPWNEVGRTNNYVDGGYQLVAGDLVQGANSLSAATFYKGVESAKSYPITVNVDTVVPTVSIDAGPPSLTNGAGASFSFSATESPVRYQCQLDGGTSFDCYGQTSLYGFSDGHYVLGVKAIDRAGNESTPATHGWTVDRTPPAVPSLTSPADEALFDAGVLVNGNVSVTGTLDGGSSVRVYFNSTSTSDTAMVGDGGTWSLTKSLDDGRYSVQAAGVDDATNASALSVPRYFTVDTTPPGTPLVTAPDPGGYVNVSSPLIQGTADARSTVVVLLQDADGGTLGPLETIANDSSAWSVLPSALQEGTYTVRVHAQDEALNSSDAGTYSFIVDTTPPIAPEVRAPTAGLVTNDAGVSIAGVAELQGDVQVYIDDVWRGAALAGGDGGDWSLPAPYPDGGGLLADGLHWVRARTRDSAGNEGLFSNTIVFTVDTQMQPATSVVSPDAGARVRGEPLVLKGVAEPGSYVDIGLDGTPHSWPAAAQASTDGGQWLFDVPVTLSDGLYTVVAVARDKAGNFSETSHSLTVDRTPPDTTINSGPANFTSQMDAGFTFSAPGETGSVNFECSLDGGFSACSSPVLYEGLGEQTYTLLVRSRDEVGNVDPSPARWQWTVDVTAPDAGIQSGPPAVTNLGLAAFQFGANEPVSYLCSVDDASYGPCSNPYVIQGVQPGNHQLRMQAMDRAGNLSAEQARSWFVDNGLPVPKITPRGLNKVTNSLQATFDLELVVPTPAGVEFSYRLGRSGSFTSLGGGTQVSLSVASEGNYRIEAKARDLVRNIETPQELYAFYDWEVDQTPPDTEIIRRPGDWDRTGVASFQFAAPGEVQVQAFECSLNSGAYTDCSGRLLGSVASYDFRGLNEGTYTLQVRAVDLAGNADSSPVEVSWAVDLSKPEPPTFDLVSGQIQAGSSLPELTGQAEAYSEVYIQLENNGELIARATTNEQGRWSARVARQLLDGLYTLKGYAVDRAGNQGQDSEPVEMLVDSQFPSVVKGGGLGCSASGGSGGVFALLGLAVLLGRARSQQRRRGNAWIDDSQEVGLEAMGRGSSRH